MDNKPYFIGIAGESGVGKSTIANIISFCLGANDTLRISTDDLHKWERTNPMWDKFTHLNPEANNLELGDMHINDLAANKPIYRSVYNHNTGNFDPPVKMGPAKFIINEGLHAFYTDNSIEKIDLKIFVDTDEDLRVHWKLLRDTEQRGYKYNAVIDSINKRKKDSQLIRDLQIKNSDVIIKLSPEQKIKNHGSKNEDITIVVEFDFNNEKLVNDQMFYFINEFILGLDDFIKISGHVGNNLELCQNNGGNVSVKVSGLMIIKSSGYELKDVHGLNGHSVVDNEKLLSSMNYGTIKDDRTLNKLIDSSVCLKEYRRPSMETGFHSLFGKYVVHTHPIYLNTILCLTNSIKIVYELYKELDYSYIEYCNPGFELYDILHYSSGCEIYFLENHGLIICTDSYQEAMNRSNEINEIAKGYLSKKCLGFEPFDMKYADLPMEPGTFYPDSAVFLDDEVITKREILAAHNYISATGKKIGDIRRLSDDNINFLRGMDAEIYRKAI